MEPLETIEQNNELVRLHDEDLGEIHRILLEMTARIGEQAEALTAAVEILGELELQFAKARFAQDYNCVAVKVLGGEAPPVTSASSAEVAKDGSGDAFVLRNARHPL